jgi:hypothetical protein
MIYLPKGVVIATLLIVVSACAGIPFHQAISPRAEAQTGRVIEAPAPPRPGALRVLLYHDMEGLAGQSDWRTYLYTFPERYREGRELLVADLNAVIGGLFSGGATEVHVVDAHGSGNPEPDIPPGRLDPRAKQLFRDKPFRQYVDLVEPGAYDAVAAVGMHAKTGSRGFSAHTFTLGTEIITRRHCAWFRQRAWRRSKACLGSTIETIGWISPPPTFKRPMMA